MTDRKYVARLLALAAALVSQPSLAQGLVEDGRCPNAKAGKQDGNGGGSSDQFNYESWIENDNEKGGKHFRRCIENQAKKPIWTHWKGVLSSNWIPVNQRLYGTNFVTGGEVDPKKTDLWWGDSKSNRIVPEAKCYKGEDSCRQEKVSSAGQLVTVQFSRSGGIPPSPTDMLATALKEKKNFSITSYQEFFVPTDASKPNEGLVKFALSATSRLVAGELNYSIAVYASEQVRQLDRQLGAPAFRLAGGDTQFSKLLSLEKVQFTYQLLRNASSRSPVIVAAVAMKPSSVVPRAMQLQVLHPSGPVVALVPISFIEGK